MSTEHKFAPVKWEYCREEMGNWHGMTLIYHTVREVGGPNVIRTDDEGTARLIAAAPALLEALEELVKINEDHNEAIGKVMGKPLNWKDTYLDKARKAIALATGKEGA